jgi:hypothetical protein
MPVTLLESPARVCEEKRSGAWTPDTEKSLASSLTLPAGKGGGGDGFRFGSTPTGGFLVFWADHAAFSG